MRHSVLPAVLLMTFAATAQTATAPLNQNFAGSWAGQLEYRDYTSGERTYLPTWVETTADPSGNAITFRYTFDDGPTKVVHDLATLTFSGTTATLSGDKDHPAQTFAVTGLEDFRKLNRGTLVLTGTGQDNGKPADLRLTITLRRNLYTWVKDVRPAGTQAPFTFRDAYTFTRIATPKG